MGARVTNFLAKNRDLSKFETKADSGDFITSEGVTATGTLNTGTEFGRCGMRSVRSCSDLGTCAWRLECSGRRALKL
ncbi:hypothetical protein TsFJ059_004510 [Trichoderma semiorbis]|uniref:Uncharacterized protein n=1 Tax=Trichoderma semiorbis TaxID=1491008 RepID=A0A9P8KQ17_9HYPO|nr:hypothetical protein TsFJ059_004510 [Trichoderma semiorbis]